MEANTLILENSKILIDSEECRLIEDAFTMAMMDLLEEGGVIEVPRVAYYAQHRGANEIWRINGFTVNKEEDEYQLELFITDYNSDSEIHTIHKKEMINLKDKLLKFFKTCYEGDINSIQQQNIIYQLASDIKENRDNISKINLFIMTNRKFANIDKQVNNELFDDIDINIHFWDIARFDALTQNSDHRNILDVNIFDYETDGLRFIESGSNESYRCYLSVINGNLLADLYRDYDTKLLESNVRSFLQQTGKVNKGIRDTIIYKPEMFLPYNNGLSATASEVSFNEKNEITGIKDFQIVNGGQTTASLYYTRKKYKIPLDKVNVALKLTILKDEELKTKEVPNISRYANTQNKVSELDLSSNHPYLIELEKLSQSIYFYDVDDRALLKYWFFERTNGQYREALNKQGTDAQKRIFRTRYPMSFKFKKADVSKWSNLFDNKPYIVSQGAQKSFLHFIKETVRELNDSIDKRYYIETIGKGVIFKWIDKCYGRHNTDPVGDTNVKSYTVSYTISLINLYLGETLDLYSIGEKQEIDYSTRDNIRLLLRHTYDFFVREANGGLISELAKKKATWDIFNKIQPPVSIEEIFSKYLHSGRIIDITDKREYLIKLDSLVAKGSNYWDALKIFSDPANSGDDLSMNERNNIEKGYNYFFRLRGSLTPGYLEKLIGLSSSIEKKFDIDEILKLSNRQPKNIPSLIDLHDKISDISEKDLKNIKDKIKKSKSRIKDKYIKAINAFSVQRKNYDEMSLEELRYFTWAIDKFYK